MVYYLQLVDLYGFHVGKYTSPMDGMGLEKNGRQLHLRKQTESDCYIDFDTVDG